MSTWRDGDTYTLYGNSQALGIDGMQSAMAFVYGNHDTINDDFTANSTISLHGYGESILQYGGDPKITISGWSATDSLSVYAQFYAGSTILPNGSGPTAASLYQDGSGGYVAPLAYGQGWIDFQHTTIAAIVGSHIVGSMR